MSAKSNNQTQNYLAVRSGMPEEKRTLGRPKRRWEDDIKMDLQEVEYETWTGSSWLRVGTGDGHL